MNRQYSNTVILFRLNASKNDYDLRENIKLIINDYPSNSAGVILKTLTKTEFFKDYIDNNILNFIDPKVLLSKCTELVEEINNNLNNEQTIVRQFFMYELFKKIGYLPKHKDGINAFKSLYGEEKYAEVCNKKDLFEIDFIPTLALIEFLSKAKEAYDEFNDSIQSIKELSEGPVDRDLVNDVEKAMRFFNRNVVEIQNKIEALRQFAIDHFVDTKEVLSVYHNEIAESKQSLYAPSRTTKNHIAIVVVYSSFVFLAFLLTLIQIIVSVERASVGLSVILALLFLGCCITSSIFRKKTGRKTTYSLVIFIISLVINVCLIGVGATSSDSSSANIGLAASIFAFLIPAFIITMVDLGREVSLIKRLNRDIRIKNKSIAGENAQKENERIGVKNRLETCAFDTVEDLLDNSFIY